MSTLGASALADPKWIAILSRIAKGPAARMGVEGYLRLLRASVHPTYRREFVDARNLRLLMAFALPEDANCIDVGAHSGTVLSEIVRLAPQGMHVAYEPLPRYYKYLVEHFPSVDVRQVAASNEAGTRSFTYLKSTPGRSGFVGRSFSHTQESEQLTVRTETLDESLPSGYVPALIKIDVEGAERLVLEGAIKTIARYKPIVVFEHGKEGAAYYETRPSQIYELLHREAGLRVFDLDGGGPYSLGRFEETYARSNRWNFVAVR